MERKVEKPGFSVSLPLLLAAAFDPRTVDIRASQAFGGGIESRHTGRIGQATLRKRQKINYISIFLVDFINHKLPPLTVSLSCLANGIIPRMGEGSVVSPVCMPSDTGISHAAGDGSFPLPALFAKQAGSLTFNCHR